MLTPDGPEFQINLQSLRHEEPSICGLQNGGYMVTWTAHGLDANRAEHTNIAFSGSIIRQSYSESGEPDGPPYLVNTTYDYHQYQSSLVQPLDGSIIVCWASANNDGSGYGVYGRAYTEDLIEKDDEFPINTYFLDNQMDPSISAMADGGFFVCWESRFQDRSGMGIFGQRYNRNAQKIGAEIPVNYLTEGRQKAAHCLSLRDEKVVSCWSNDLTRPSTGAGIYYRILDLASLTSPVEKRVDTDRTDGQRESYLIATTAQQFLVLWSGRDALDGKLGIFGRRFDENGVAVDVVFKINEVDSINTRRPSACTTSSGKVLVTWERFDGSKNKTNIVARLLEEDGSPASREFVVNSEQTGSQSHPKVSSFVSVA